MSNCFYKKGGSKKYVLLEFIMYKLEFSPSVDIDTSYCVFKRNGNLFINAGYEWDGASGPTIDTDDTMDGSLMHDVLYQLMREEKLSRKFRRKADNAIHKMCIAAAYKVIDNSDINIFRKAVRKAGVSIRFDLWYVGLRIGGGSSARQ